MANNEIRKQKIEWMKKNIKLFKEKDLLKQFCNLFCASMANAREIYNLTK